jgi:hypothetical protein
LRLSETGHCKRYLQGSRLISSDLKFVDWHAHENNEKDFAVYYYDSCHVSLQFIFQCVWLPLCCFTLSNFLFFSFVGYCFIAKIISAKTFDAELCNSLPLLYTTTRKIVNNYTAMIFDDRIIINNIEFYLVIFPKDFLSLKFYHYNCLIYHHAQWHFSVRYK